MAIKNIRLTMRYWAFNEEDNKLIVDAVVLAVMEARAVAQSLLMTSKDELPPPTVSLQADDEYGVLREINPEEWQASRIAEAEEDNDGAE